MRVASRRSLRARPPRRWRMPFRLRRSNRREMPEEPRGVGGCRRATTHATARCRKRIPMGAHLKYAVIKVALPVGVAAGCGGGGKTYSDSATQSCLKRAGATITVRDADEVARDAGGGGYQVRLRGKILNIAFGRDLNEAKQLLDIYQSVGGSEAGLYRTRNAVFSWDDDPGPDRSTVDECLG